jgi:chorismate mutase / prephenate dehydrogenase
MAGDDLLELRDRLNAIDDDLVTLAGRRMELVAEIGRVKRASGRPDRDAGREEEVMARARRTAVRQGVPPDLAEALLRALVRASLQLQEEDRVKAHGSGAGRSALVIGGEGRMGRWFVRFLTSQGFRVTSADPAGPVVADEPSEHVRDWHGLEADADVIVVATPLAAADSVLRELADRRPRGLVFDIGSLKSPLRGAFEALRAAGVRATSVHPMFGPDVALLSGRHVVFVDLGDAGATAEARGLFAPTMAIVLDMSLDDHDRHIGWVLGMSHALNIAFFTALARSGVSAADLDRISSTTFDAQLETAARVARENPRLYFEIQALNAHGRVPLQALRRAVDDLVERVIARDEDGFVGLMDAGRDYLKGRQSPGDSRAAPGVGRRRTPPEQWDDRGSLPGLARGCLPWPRSETALRPPQSRGAGSPCSVDYALQGRVRSGNLSRNSFFVMLTSSFNWKSYIPTDTKSAPLLKAYLKPSLGWIAPAARTL